MKRLVVLVLLLGASSRAFGWGNATHVYFAHRLGAKIGPVNIQEMYGALGPDVFNYLFDVNGFFLASQAHFSPENVYALANTPEKKAFAFGFMTHNNVYGADLTAHGSPDFPNPLWPARKPGWVIKYGNIAAGYLVAPLKQILAAAGVPDGAQDGLASYLAPTMGHDLVETAVDILVKRNQDPLIGLRMAIAARARTPQAGILLADAYATSLVAFTGGSDEIPDVDEATARALIIGAESQYQLAMEQYGQAFMLPEKQLIKVLAQQSAAVGKILIETVLTQELGDNGWNVTVDPALVEENIPKCMVLVKHVYAAELENTLDFTARQLALHNIRTASACMALGKEQDPGDELVAEMAAPEDFALDQNYPNPFNPTTLISYSVPVGTRHAVSLRVFDLLGREVAVLVNETKDPGRYSVTWDAHGMPSGVYFCRLEAGSVVSTKRMTLLK
jgi:hypothetical protein